MIVAILPVYHGFVCTTICWYGVLTHTVYSAIPRRLVLVYRIFRSMFGFRSATLIPVQFTVDSRYVGVNMRSVVVCVYHDNNG